MNKSELLDQLSFDSIGNVPVSSLKTDYIRIQNRDQFLFDIPMMHPKDPQYLKFWRRIKKLCVEGMWGYEFGHYRYMPPALLFYGNLALIEDTDENKQTIYIKPEISDLEWEIFYGLFEAEGFSGFSGDDNNSSDELLLKYKKSSTPLSDIDETRLFKPNGTLKDYIPPRENIKMLHESDRGVPLYYNEARNFSILGSRGGGKSYSIGLGKILHAIVVDGGKYYDERTGKFYRSHHYNPKEILDEKNHPIAVTVVGSGDTDKSSEFCSKIHASMNSLATEARFGVWGEPGDWDYTPCPLFKDMSGSLMPGNKKNPWQHKYKLLVKGREVPKGTTSRLFHVSYSDKKQGGGQAGAGGRYLYSVIEEQGLCFAKGTEVRMFNGSIKNIQDIEDGDLVMGPDGSKRTVIGTTSGVDIMYKVKQTFGNDYVVNSEHPICVKKKLWASKRSSYSGYKIETKFIKAKDYDDISNKQAHYGYKNSLQQFSKKDINLDPYFLGYWLGDGDRGGTNFTTMDNEVVEYLSEMSQNYDLEVRLNGKSGKSSTYRIAGNKGNSENKLLTQLRSYNLIKNKHIPIDFIHNTKEVRLQLLAGLLDSDGCLLDKKTYNCYEFYQTNRKELVEQVQYLCQTLGLRATISERVITTGCANKEIGPRTKYKVRISGNIAIIPCKVLRKKTYYRNYKKNFLYTSIKVEKLEKDTYYGFTLKEDSLFLLKDGTVVHNTKNTIEVFNSNNSAVARNGRQFGVQIFLGTSGNLDMIKQTRKMFMNPQDYRITTYQDEWEGMGKDGKIGFFLPYYMTLRRFKDKQGNTKYKETFEFIKERRDLASKSDDPSVLREEKMNRPIVPSEMWILNKGYYLPYEEAVSRERELLKGNKFMRVGTPVKLTWHSESTTGVTHNIQHNADPFYEFPINDNRLNLDGCIMIYHFPKENEPKDMYIFTHDPYVSENLDEGGSLGVTHGWVNPKYWDEHMPATGPMVCTYIAKPLGGLKQYYENQEKLIHFYGAPPQGLAYEANRGADCKNHYLKKGKAHLLFPRPQVSEGQNIYAKKIMNYGITVSGSGKLGKIQMLDRTYDFLLEDIFILGKEMKLIETIPCIFTIRQIIAFDIEYDNYDAVSSMILYPAVIRELEYKLIKERQEKRENYNELAFLSMNTSVFKEADLQRRVELFNKKYNLEKNEKVLPEDEFASRFGF